jgi:hypothetical protein
MEQFGSRLMKLLEEQKEKNKEDHEAINTNAGVEYRAAVENEFRAPEVIYQPNVKLNLHCIA